jgi:hypothetical protein
MTEGSVGQPRRMKHRAYAPTNLGCRCPTNVRRKGQASVGVSYHTSVVSASLPLNAWSCPEKL